MAKAAIKTVARKTIAKGRKANGRTMPIYPRVQGKSHNWLSKAVATTGKSQSEIVDYLLWQAANQYATIESIEDLFGDATKA